MYSMGITPNGPIYVMEESTDAPNAWTILPMTFTHISHAQAWIDRAKEEEARARRQALIDKRRTILIDAVARTVTEGTLPEGPTLEYLQQHLGSVEAPAQITAVKIKTGENLFVDDEGLLKHLTAFFLFCGMGSGVGPEVFAGNGVVAGVTEEGETVGTTMRLAEVSLRVDFFSTAAAAEAYMAELKKLWKDNRPSA